MSAWTDHVEKWKDCQACPLGRQRTRICLARGTTPADVLFIGQAPGASEDAKGQPFVGPAGDLLDQIIARALPPEVRYALTNLVCCFPAEAKAQGSEEPEYEEILACRPRLIELVNIVQPRLIVCVGSLAGQFVEHYDTIPCVDIIHPAYILRKDMPRVQKNMAAQKIVVTIRSAVNKMLSSERPNFTKWGESYASSQPKPRLTKNQLRADYDQWTKYDDPIPF